MPKDRNFSLDVIRAVSVLMIIFFHYNCETVRIISKDVNLLSFYGYAGNIGVSMFLILSGAALTFSTRESFSIGNFFKKRFLAIFPLFWTVYILFVLGSTILLRTYLFPDRHPVSFILTILGIDGLMTYRGLNYYLIGEWFLGCILILYLLYPAIRYLFYINKHVLLVISLVLCLVLERIYCLDMPLLWFPLFRMFEFVFGMYFITFSKEHVQKQNILLLIISASGILTILLFYTGGSVFISNIAVGILCFTALISLSNMHLPKSPLFRESIRILSKYSFTAFLLHHLMLVQIVQTFQNYLWMPYLNWAVFFATLIFIYLCAYAVYNALRSLLRTPIAVQ
jgi:peptidoglycan/LPS O-acetylase OafA/YrhL